MVGDEWGMNIEQIVPDEIPDDGTPEMDEIRRMRIHGERRKAVEETVTEIGWSVCFCGLTTIVSLLSFLVIPIRPMKCVGMICSMTVH